MLRQQGLSLEVLVVDDSAEGSARSTVQALADARVRYLPREGPTGCNPALLRNSAARVARGRYLHFLDDGDRLEADSLGVLKGSLDATHNAGMAFGAVVPFGGDEQKLRHEDLLCCRIAVKLLDRSQMPALACRIQAQHLLGKPRHRRLRALPPRRCGILACSLMGSGAVEPAASDAPAMRGSDLPGVIHHGTPTSGSAAGVAALLASPAMAKAERHHHTAPSLTSIPADAHAFAPYGAPVTVYSPDVRVPVYTNGITNPDFQLGAEK